MSEAAILSLPLIRARILFDQKRRNSKDVLYLKENMGIVIGTIVLVNNAVNIAGSIFVGQYVGKIYRDDLQHYHHRGNRAEAYRRTLQDRDIPADRQAPQMDGLSFQSDGQIFDQHHQSVYQKPNLAPRDRRGDSHAVEIRTRCRHGGDG